MAHPGHGGCTIREISRRDYGGESKLYFVLVPQIDPMTTILAPVENMQKIGYRDIMSEERADQLLAYFREATEVDWVSDHAKRKRAYEEILKEGDLPEIARMIKELVMHESEANLNHCDKEMLPKAQKRLFSEIALAKGMDFEHVLDMANDAIAG